MTLIIAYKNPDEVILASDTRVSVGDFEHYNMKSKKIIKVNDHMLVGCAGSLSLANTLLHCVDYDGSKASKGRIAVPVFNEILKNIHSFQECEKWIITNIVPKLKTALKNENGISFKEKEKEESLEFDMLIVLGRHIFRVCGDLSVYSIYGDFIAIGSVAATAHAVYSATKYLQKEDYLDYSVVENTKIFNSLMFESCSSNNSSVNCMWESYSVSTKINKEKPTANKTPTKGKVVNIKKEFDENDDFDVFDEIDFDVFDEIALAEDNEDDEDDGLIRKIKLTIPVK